MAFFPNSGSSSSSSSGHSSSGDSDSEEKRFYQKTNNSQRQRSSSTSASSPDSEPEQVSTRLGAENPAAKKHDAPSSKKKPDALDSFVVRNQGTPSEPNPKVPSTSKRQRSSSKCASSSEPEQLSTRPAAENPAATVSPRKKPDAPLSSKKKTDSSDSSTVRNQGTPSGPNPKLPSTSKLKKVASGQRAKVDGAAEEQHHEPSKDMKKKQRKQKQESSAIFEDPKAPKASNTVEAPGSSTPILNGVLEDRLDYEIFMKETRDMLAEFTRDAKNMVGNFDVEMRALLDSHLHSTNGTRGAGGFGRIIHSAWLRSREPDLDEVYSLRELPAMDEARLQVMEEKWREVRLLELEAKSQRLALLQEQCSMHIEALKATRGNAIS